MGEDEDDVYESWLETHEWSSSSESKRKKEVGMALGTEFSWFLFLPARCRGHMAFPLSMDVKWICKIILHSSNLVSWVGTVKVLRELV